MICLEKLETICRNNPQIVIFAEAKDKSIIKAARVLSDQGLAKPILLGGAFELRDLAEKINVATKGLLIKNPNHEKETKPYLSKVIAQSRNKKLSKFEAGQIVKEPITQAIMRLICGNGHIAFAGNKSNISKVISAGLKWSGVKATYKRLSSYYLLISEDNQDIFALADCSINIAPDPAQLAEIAIKTAANFQIITGRQPRVAFLSFSTKGSANHEKVDIVREAVNIFSKNSSGIACDGELQFDAAVDKTIARKKAPNGSLNGNANVFIFPSLNSANIAQKIAVEIGAYRAIGPMFQGLENHLHSLPKSCAIEEIINSVLLASVIKLKTNY